ncbi:hypothetical protein Aduo_013097 [Ancylostoma duodenale]
MIVVRRPTDPPALSRRRGLDSPRRQYGWLSEERRCKLEGINEKIAHISSFLPWIVRGCLSRGARAMERGERAADSA